MYQDLLNFEDYDIDFILSYHKGNFCYTSVMRVISKKTLKVFYEKPEYRDSKTALEAWHYEILKSSFSNPNEIKQKYKSASIIGNNTIVFNICGNKYRLVVKINYIAQIVFIKFIGTHKEYDKINIKEI